MIRCMNLVKLAPVVAVLALAACGGSTAPTTVTSTPPPAVAPVVAKPSPTPTPLSYYAAQYTRLVTPFNTALDKLGNAPTQAQLNDLADKTTAADVALLRASWPSAKVQSDIEALVRSDGAVIGDLQQNNGAEFTRDAETATANAEIVRADLGLPPVKG